MHHVADMVNEFWRFINAVAVSLFFGAFVWLAYLAIEPIARRRWPELLFCQTPLPCSGEGLRGARARARGHNPGS
jgi:lipopolysaccharide biosynthesis protein